MTAPAPTSMDRTDPGHRSPRGKVDPRPRPGRRGGPHAGVRTAPEVSPTRTGRREGPGGEVKTPGPSTPPIGDEVRSPPLDSTAVTRWRTRFMR